MTMEQAAAAEKARLGVTGLDDILVGGLARGHLYLLEGSPGTGKTTVALQFLLEGAQKGEVGLYVTLSETENELRLTAQSHGWEIGTKFDIFELAPPDSLLENSAFVSLWKEELDQRSSARTTQPTVGIQTPARRA